MKYDTLRIIWHSIGILATLLALTLFTLHTITPTRVTVYELGSCSAPNGLVINANTMNGPDASITLVGVDYAQAVALIDSLNAGLNRHYK